MRFSFLMPTVLLDIIKECCEYPYTTDIANIELCSHSETTHARNNISILQLFHTIAVEFLCASDQIWTWFYDLSP